MLETGWNLRFPPLHKLLPIPLLFSVVQHMKLTPKGRPLPSLAFTWNVCSWKKWINESTALLNCSEPGGPGSTSVAKTSVEASLYAWSCGHFAGWMIKGFRIHMKAHVSESFLYGEAEGIRWNLGTTSVIKKVWSQLYSLISTPTHTLKKLR